MIKVVEIDSRRRIPFDYRPVDKNSSVNPTGKPVLRVWI
jgi:hypothetical protein